MKDEAHDAIITTNKEEIPILACIICGEQRRLIACRHTPFRLAESPPLPPGQ
jgi:hypothetical protein